MLTKTRFGAAVLSVLFLSVTTAGAADPAVNCEAGKLKEAGKYGNCRLKADSKAVKKGIAADYTKCESKFADKWTKTETKAGSGLCPSEGDQLTMDARITTDAAEIATLLAGGSVPACGDGTVDAGEDCDFGDLDGETCATQGLFGEGLACTPGTCVFDTSGCSLTRYEDTGLGSVIDHQTGLEWQKTDDAGGLTHKDNFYTWTDGADGDLTDPDGTAFTEFLEGLNGGTTSGSSGPTTAGFAGHNDWRIPRIEELTTIVDCSFGNPCIDQSVFGATSVSTWYFSSTTLATGPISAWGVNLGSGNAFAGNKNGSLQYRAVRDWADLLTCNGDLSTCQSSEATCQGDLTTCNGSLSTCQGDLSTCSGDLTTAQGDLSTCSGDLSTCQVDLTACQSEPAGGLTATGQTTSYGSGTDGDVQAGAALAYADNGDGTITDLNTGLMWEKKDDSNGIHDKDNTYTWCGASCGTTNEMDGTITTTFLDTLNDVGGGGAACFAGHCDWRIPNVNELQSIVDYEVFSPPSIDPAFHEAGTCTGCVDVTAATCSCTGSSGTWSSTTLAPNPSAAWNVSFSIGSVTSANKSNFVRHVRAVRGGL